MTQFQPLTVYNMTNDVCDYCIESWIAMEICVILLHLNAVINPFLYAYQFKEFRVSFGKVFRCQCGAVDQNSTQMTLDT